MAERSNPYEPPESEANISLHSRRPTSSDLLLGATWSVLSSFPIAALMVSFFRFPIPMVGYVSGWKAIGPAMLAVVFYGIFFGGFLVLAGMGAMAGSVVSALNYGRRRRSWIQGASIIVTALLLFVLAILDRIIGPW